MTDNYEEKSEPEKINVIEEMPWKDYLRMYSDSGQRGLEIIARLTAKHKNDINPVKYPIIFTDNVLRFLSNNPKAIKELEKEIFPQLEIINPEYSELLRRRYIQKEYVSEDMFDVLGEVRNINEFHKIIYFYMIKPNISGNKHNYREIRAIEGSDDAPEEPKQDELIKRLNEIRANENFRRLMIRRRAELNIPHKKIT
jgi:hypothetical protein